MKMPVNHFHSHNDQAFAKPQYIVFGLRDQAFWAADKQWSEAAAQARADGTPLPHPHGVDPEHPECERAHQVLNAHRIPYVVYDDIQNDASASNQIPDELKALTSAAPRFPYIVSLDDKGRPQKVISLNALE